MKKFGLTLMVLVVALVLVPIYPFAMAKEKPVKYLKIGCNYGLTGVVASALIPSKNLLELEADRINKKGGIIVGGQRYHIKLIFEDNGYTSEGGIAVATKLIDRENVKFIFVPGTPGVAQTSLTEPAKVLSFLTGVADQAIINKKYSIKNVQLIQINIIALLDYISKNIPGVKRVCLLFKNDSSGIINSETLPKVCAHYGMEFVGYELYPLKETDFYPLLARMLPKKPDLIVTDVGTGGGLMVKQAVEKGYKGYFMGTTIGADNLFRQIGDKVPDGMFLAPIVDPDSAAAPREIRGIREIKRRYEERYGKDHPMDAAYTYHNYLMLLIQAVKKAGTVDDTDKIRDVITKNTWDLPWGKTSFVGKEVWGVDGQGIMPVFVSTWIGSKKEIKFLKVIPGDNAYQVFVKMFGKK